MQVTFGIGTMGSLQMWSFFCTPHSWNKTCLWSCKDTKISLILNAWAADWNFPSSTWEVRGWKSNGPTNKKYSPYIKILICENGKPNHLVRALWDSEQKNSEWSQDSAPMPQERSRSQNVNKVAAKFGIMSGALAPGAKIKMKLEPAPTIHALYF